MQPPERPGEVVASEVIAHLQRSVQALMDGDRVLPADGSSLLATLDRALAGPDGESAPPGTREAGGSLRPRGPAPPLRGSPPPTQWVDAQAGIEAFIGWAQALIEAGVLAAADGRPRIEAAAAMGALLRSAGGTDLNTCRRQGAPPGDNAAPPQTDRLTEAEAERRPPLAERKTER